MNKKVIALILSCVMLVSASPVVAAEDTPVKPTVEEILSEYHQKAFEAQTAEDTDKTTTYSNRSGSKTLEQETVDTLNAAGYEAYNVTAFNYDALEAQLKTDFSSMGLDPNGSYIVVISGEDSDNSHNSRAYGDNLITPTPGPTEGGAYFEYSFYGSVYKLRYFTITAADDPTYGTTSENDLLDHFSVNEIIQNGLNAAVYAIADHIATGIPLGTIASLCGFQFFDFNETNFERLELIATTNWTRRFIQVWDDYYEAWTFSTCVESVTARSYLSGDYYDPTLNRYVSVEKNEHIATSYTEHYDDREWLHEKAVRSFLNNYISYETTGAVRYYYDDTLIATHWENF